MRIGPILILLVLLTGGALRAQDRLVDERRFAVEAGTTLKLDTFAGAIKIVPTAGTDEIVIRLQAEATGGRPGAAQRWLEGVTISTEQQERQLSVVIRHRSGPVSIDLGEKPTGLVRLEILVPLRTHLDVNGGSASVETGHDLEGDVRIRVAVGTIFLGRTFGRVSVRVDDGSISVSRATGVVDLRTLRGDIRVGTLADSATLETGSGDINIFSAERGINARAAAGSIDATVGEGLSEDSVLATAGGDIRVAVNSAANVSVRARSVWGRITARLPIMTTAGGAGQSRLEGSINRGGSQLSLHASGGNILMTSVENDGG